MLDNVLATNVISVINAGLIAQGFSGFKIYKGFQPTTQGPEPVSTPSVYFTKLPSRRYGSMNRKDVWDSINSVMVHAETQFYETTYQISAAVISNPTALSYTASDLVNAAAQSLNSDYAISTFKSNNINVLRVTDIRNPYFLDDLRRFEASPSFDVTFITEMVVTSGTGVVDSFLNGVYPV